MPLLILTELLYIGISFAIYAVFVILMSLGFSITIHNLREIFVHIVYKYLPTVVANILHGLSFLAFGLMGYATIYSSVFGFFLGFSLLYSIGLGNFLLCSGICSSFLLGTANYFYQQNGISVTPFILFLNWVAYTCGAFGGILSHIAAKFYNNKKKHHKTIKPLIFTKLVGKHI